MAIKALKNKRIVLTKSQREDDEIKLALEKAGAEVLDLPLIDVTALDDPERVVEVLKGIATYEWIVFSSVNGVKYFFENFFRAFKDIRCFGGARIACVGKQTAAAVEKYLLEVDLIPNEQTGLKLAEALVETDSLPSAFVLWVSGDKVNKEAVSHLEAKGEAIVDVFTVYHSHLRPLDNDPVALDFREKGADGLLFASASAVESFVKQAGSLTPAKGASFPKTVSIGPSTSEAMKQQKVPLDKESKSPEASEVIKALKALLK